MIRFSASPAVLVVEDEKILGSLLMEVLESEGFQPIVTQRVEEAEAVLQRTAVDLILADLWSPAYDDSAWRPVARLREAAPGVPVIICTAHAQASREDPGSRQVFDIVIKPFDLDDLVSRIRRALGEGSRPDSARPDPLILASEGSHEGNQPAGFHHER